MLVLDWHHPRYRYQPHLHALADDETWPVEVSPDGDYYAFLTEDMDEGSSAIPGSRRCAFSARG
ncbi:DUF2716 domain-containing protein [Winogradskya humida]|uniref:DUF2716 domain-containing protein n=1 Tax=Winogradskya humida TaxID=113566 RepID=UPI0034DAD618